MDDSSGGGAAQIWTATLGELLALKSPPSEEQQLHTARRGRPLTSPNQSPNIRGRQPWWEHKPGEWIILLFDTRRPNKSSANLLSGLRSGE